MVSDLNHKGAQLAEYGSFFYSYMERTQISVCSNYMLIQTCIKVCENVSVTMVTR